MCTGRVDLSFILRAFLKGADGVIIGGCWPGECHYVTEGNYDALGNVQLCKKLLAYLGTDPERLRLEWIAASEGSRFADVMNDFVSKQRGLGPCSKGEGIDGGVLLSRLETALKVVPYIKLVERERLRAPVKSEESIRDFYASDEASSLFEELIAEKLTMGQILQLLKEKPLSTGEISESLSLDPREVSRHMNSSSRQGLVKYNVELKCYALA